MTQKIIKIVGLLLIYSPTVYCAHIPGVNVNVPDHRIPQNAQAPAQNDVQEACPICANDYHPDKLVRHACCNASTCVGCLLNQIEVGRQDTCAYCRAPLSVHDPIQYRAQNQNNNAPREIVLRNSQLRPTDQEVENYQRLRRYNNVTTNATIAAENRIPINGVLRPPQAQIPVDNIGLGDHANDLNPMERRLNEQAFAQNRRNQHVPQANAQQNIALADDEQLALQLQLIADQERVENAQYNQQGLVPAGSPVQASPAQGSRNRPAQQNNQQPAKQQPTGFMHFLKEQGPEAFAGFVLGILLRPHTKDGKPEPRTFLQTMLVPAHIIISNLLLKKINPQRSLSPKTVLSWIVGTGIGNFEFAQKPKREEKKKLAQ
jgi:hypothetical protein